MEQEGTITVAEVQTQVEATPSKPKAAKKVKREMFSQGAKARDTFRVPMITVAQFEGAARFLLKNDEAVMRRSQQTSRWVLKGGARISVRDLYSVLVHMKLVSPKNEELRVYLRNAHVARRYGKTIGLKLDWTPGMKLDAAAEAAKKARSRKAKKQAKVVAPEAAVSNAVAENAETIAA